MLEITNCHHIPHVSAMATNLKVLNLLWLACTPVENTKPLFRALVLPVLDYVNVVWNSHTQKCVSALEKIQNCGVHWVCGSRFNPVTFKWPYNLQKTAAESYIGYHCLPDKSISV